MDYTPDIYYGSFTSVTPEVLKTHGVKVLMTDLDDTLVTHGNMDVNASVKTWAKKITGEGIRIFIISNNTTGRVKPFADELGVDYICNAMKPSPKFIDKVCYMCGVSKEDVILMGDQLFTDIRAAKKGDIRSILVDPVGTKTTLFIKFKRLKEKRIRKNFRRDDL